MTVHKKKFKFFLKEIFSDQYKHGNVFLYFIILINFSLIAYYNLNNEFVMSSDSGQFSRWADILITLNFNLYNYYIQNTFINPNYLYTIPIVIIAIFKLIFETTWQNAFVFFNLILIFFSLILFTKSLLLLKVRPLIISMAIPLLTLSVDLLTWPRYILTDTIFAFLIILIFYFMIKSLIKKDNYYFLFTFFIIILFFTRPTSLPFIFVITVFLIVSRLQINYAPKIVLSIICFLFIFTPFLFTFLYKFMQTNFGDNAQALFIIRHVEKGVIIDDRPETWLNTPKVFLDYFFLYLVRLLYFFIPYVKSFSTIHIIINMIQPIIVFLSLAIWIKLGNKFENMNKSIALVLFVSFSVAAFHSFTLIDYDFRYRFPIIMPLMLVFPISTEIVVRKISNKIF